MQTGHAEPTEQTSHRRAPPRRPQHCVPVAREVIQPTPSATQPIATYFPRALPNEYVQPPVAVKPCQWGATTSSLEGFIVAVHVRTLSKGQGNRSAVCEDDWWWVATARGKSPIRLSCSEGDCPTVPRLQHEREAMPFLQAQRVSRHGLWKCAQKGDPAQLCVVGVGLAMTDDVVSSLLFNTCGICSSFSFILALLSSVSPWTCIFHFILSVGSVFVLTFQLLFLALTCILGFHWYFRVLVAFWHLPGILVLGSLEFN